MDGEVISQWMQYALTWIGFGTLVGLLAKALLPGKDPGGALPTVLIGILGSLIGAALLSYLSNGVRVSPISFLGFLVALAGTTLLLLSYRLMNGQGVRGVLSGWGRFRRGRRKISVVEEK
jgi:uncharacterized membrane protein YeaQ/YmgE (transglycosylase-associated protein family)